MTTHRVYSEALAPQAAARELHVNAGSQFDPLVVDAALAVLTRDETRAIALTHG
jgi:HD-GYP domain-containing protein (c-di-GMP phosphodiesterase class II)